MTWNAPPRVGERHQRRDQVTPSSTTLMFSASRTRPRHGPRRRRAPPALRTRAAPGLPLASPLPAASIAALSAEPPSWTSGARRIAGENTIRITTADGVGGDLVDAKQRRELDRERRLAGAGGAAEGDHERSGRPADAPHGAIARGGVAAFEPLDVIGDAAPELGVADAVDSLAQELALHLDRDAVGAVGVEAGGDQAAREQAARERLRLFSVVRDVGLARRGAGRHHGGEALRRELGLEDFGEQVVELGVGDFARVARRQPIAHALARA